MEEIQFTSMEDLYKRLLPALRSKKKMLRQNGYGYIKLRDIWDALRILKWHMGSGLMLSDLVDDILHTENALFYRYYCETYLHSKEEVELPKLKEE